MRYTLRSPAVLLPVVSLGLVLLGFVLTPAHTGTALTSFDLYNAFQGFAAIGFLTLALGLTMIAGEYDLSVAGTAAAAGMFAVMTGEHSGMRGVLIVVACGAVIGTVQGLIITRFKISSIPVTLATYIGLLGLTNSLGGGQSKTFDNANATLWVDQQVLTFLSPRSIICLGAFGLVAVLLGCTRLGRELRAVGGDRRASRVVGIRVDRVLVGLFGSAGALAALGGALVAYSYSSASADPGIQPLILGTVAALLGGVSLAGGRGAPLGLLAGAMSVAFLAQIVLMAALPDYYTQLFYAALLGIIVLIDAPDLKKAVAKLRTRAHAKQFQAVTPAKPGTSTHHHR